MKKLVIEKGRYGKKAILQSTWHPSFLDVLLDQNIEELELNDGKGWSGNNLDFLKFLTSLKSFTIFDFKITSVLPVHELKMLKNLEIYTYCKTPIDFTVFPDLQQCGLEWRKKSESLFNSKGLTSLFINNYKSQEFDAFTSLSTLKDLAILNAKIENLNKIEQLQELQYLRLGNLKDLLTLKGISGLKKLEVLEINRCKKLTTFEEIFQVKNLNKLLLLDMGDILTIKGIENLQNLEEFLFYDSSNIVDGDLSSLCQINKLKKVAYRDRAHYSHRRDDLMHMLNKRK